MVDVFIMSGKIRSVVKAVMGSAGAEVESGAEALRRRLRLVAAAPPPRSSLPYDALFQHFADPGVDLIGLPFILDWIIEFISEWEGTFKHTNKSVKTFVLRLAALATENESIFMKLKDSDLYENLSTFRILQENDPSIKLGVLKILASMTHHRSGIQFLLKNRQWEDVLDYCHKTQTIYFVRIEMDFISSFIWQLSDLNFETECEDIIMNILSVLLNNQWKNATTIYDEENIEMSRVLTPTLNMLIDILDNAEHFGKATVVSKTIQKHNLEWNLWNLFNLCRRSVLLGNISKLLFLTRICKVYSDKEGSDKINQNDMVEFCITHANIMMALIAKRDAESILSVTNFCFIYIKKMCCHYKISTTIEKEEGTFDFINQIIMMSIIPTLCALRHRKNEFIDHYIGKLVSLSCEHTTRMAYAFRDLVKENNTSICIKAIQHGISLKKHLTKPQAITIFQSFYYKLQDFVPENEDINNYTIDNIESKEACLLLFTLLDAIYIYIEEFDIPWQDTVEVLCVYNFCTRVMKTSNLEPKLIIQSFKLAQLTIKKFLSPNLALLMNSAQGSVIEEIGKLIYEKLHDPCWDIRDSAMELLYVVTDIAEFKFPAFQQQITENNLPELVVTLAMEDSESYVRASALHCIAAMVRIQILWENHLQFLDLTVKMMNILHDESEGLVRKEAANVMVNIYEYQKFTLEALDSVFMTMFHAAAEDLHWEVQLTALQFWKKVIANQMSHQGMIDGIFPSVTFSKENRKIVHLNEFEIRNRLKKILNELALRGCLGVLLSCMQDDSDLAVMEQSLEIISELLELLDKYNMSNIEPEDASTFTSRPIFDENFLKNDAEIAKIGSYRNKADVRSEKNSITLCGGQNSDSVIESIINSKDVNLLANVYANRLKVNSEEIQSKKDIKMRNCVNNVSSMFVEPEVFIKTVREANYKKVISNKRKWISNISTDINSILDDILGSYDINTDINTLDCY